jgi:hypothetical protein
MTGDDNPPGVRLAVSPLELNVSQDGGGVSAEILFGYYPSPIFTGKSTGRG